MPRPPRKDRRKTLDRRKKTDRREFPPRPETRRTGTDRRSS
jgi:hypothetical protein